MIRDVQRAGKILDSAIGIALKNEIVNLRIYQLVTLLCIVLLLLCIVLLLLEKFLCHPQTRKGAGLCQYE